MNTTTIIAFDPGFERLGWAVAEVVGVESRILAYGCVRSSKNDSFMQRLTQIMGEVTEIFERFQPATCVLETLFFSKNQTTALAVAEVRGMLKTVAALHSAAVVEYNPSTVKVAAAGHGQATKPQVEKMVRLQLGKQLTKAKIIDDTLDALALIITHAASVRITKRV